MSWIKRNLPFVIGGVVAVALLGLAGFYFYSKWQLNNKNLEELERAYADWERITNLNPNPGNTKTNNIENARAQQARARAVIDRVQRYFAPIPSVPNPENGVITKEAFASALRRTIQQLQRDATNAGVELPPNYTFSFEAQKDLYSFAPGSLEPLSKQLGEIKMVCNILFKSKINALRNVRRERISPDDYSANAVPDNYLEQTHVGITNEMAILAPYEVQLECFSAELASVLAGFASTPHGFIVKSVNVVPASGTAAVTPGATPYENPYAQAYTPEALRARGVYGNPYNPYAAAAAAAAAAQAPATRGGLQTVLDEKPLSVTLVLDVVRLLPKN